MKVCRKCGAHEIVHRGPVDDAEDLLELRVMPRGSKTFLRPRVRQRRRPWSDDGFVAVCQPVRESAELLADDAPP